MNKEIEQFMLQNAATFSQLDDGDEREVWHNIDKEDNIAYRIQFAIGDGQSAEYEELLYVQELENEDEDAIYEILGLTITDKYLRLAYRRPSNYTFVQLHNQLRISYNGQTNKIEIRDVADATGTITTIPLRFFVDEDGLSSHIATFIVRFLTCISSQNVPDYSACKQAEKLYLRRQEERECLMNIQILEEDLQEKKYYQSHFIRHYKFSFAFLGIGLFALVYWYMHMQILVTDNFPIIGEYEHYNPYLFYWIVSVIIYLLMAIPLAAYLIYSYMSVRGDVKQLQTELKELKMQGLFTEATQNITKRKRAGQYVPQQATDVHPAQR